MCRTSEPWFSAPLSSMQNRLQRASVKRVSGSGGMKQSQRKEFQGKFVSQEIQVLCACDLLHEGWGCPETEVLFMACPILSKV